MVNLAIVVQIHHHDPVLRAAPPRDLLGAAVVVDVEQHRSVGVVGELDAVVIQVEDQGVDVDGVEGLLGDVI